MKRYRILSLLLIIACLFVSCKLVEENEENILSTSLNSENAIKDNTVSPEVIREDNAVVSEENGNINSEKVNPYSPRQQTETYFDNDCYLRTGSELSVNFNTDVSLESDALYLFNPNTNSIERQFSDCLFPQTNSYVLPFSVQKQGIFAICNADSVALFDKNGEKVKTVYESVNGPIKDFLVVDNLVWVFCNGSIIRIDQRTETSEIVYAEIESNNFCMFLYPISLTEVEWQEYGKEFWDCALKEGYIRNASITPGQSDGFDSFLFQHSSLPEFVACYYNSETEELITKDIYPLSETKNIGTNWWLLSDNVFDVFEKYSYEIPSIYHLSGFNYTITTGGGKYITDYNKNNGNPVGFIAVDFDLDMQRIIYAQSDSAFSSIFQNIERTEQYSDNLYTSICSIMDYNMAETAREYYTAFLCMENQPVFVFCLRADLFEKNEFLSICSTIHFCG